VLGLQVPAAANVGTHEALHCYLETDAWPCQVEFHEDHGGHALVGDHVPHVLVYVAGYWVGALVLLPWAMSVRKLYHVLAGSRS